MKPNPNIARASINLEPQKPVRSTGLLLLGVIFFLGVGAAIYLDMQRRRTASTQNQPSSVGAGKQAGTGQEAIETTGAGTAPSTTIQMIVPRNPHAVTPAGVLPASADARQLVASLTEFNLSKGPMSPEAAAAWRQNLHNLTAQGAAAVPAIREFLEKNVDLSFDATSANLLQQPTMRLAFLEALQNIGGADALALSSQTLQTTLDPREIGWLAQSLEQRAPGEYAEMAAQAARDALAAAESGGLGERDVSAVFGVLQKFGGEGGVVDLEKYAEQYPYYAAISLANMPDGAGVPFLISLLRDSQFASTGGRGPALQMLAQVALDSPKALDFLLQQARQNQIPSSTWAGISSILAGDRMQIGTPPPDSGARTFHVANGNQNIYTLPDHSQWPPDQVNRHIEIVNQLAGANRNPTAAAALQNTLASLQARLQ